MKKERMYQAVVITFDDGSTATFTGRAVVWPGEKRRTVKIQFTEPEELPEDCSFGFLDEPKKEKGE